MAKRTTTLAVLIMLLMTSTQPAWSEVIRVDIDATDPNPDGSTWALAYHDLQSALDHARNNAFAFDEIWVSEGTYVAGTQVTDTFAMEDGVSIYGGFTGTETSVGQRDPDPASNGTILSGDLGGGNFSNVIVTSAGNALTAVIDGFTISDAVQHAVLIENSSVAQFRDLLIRDNTTSFSSGAGMYVDDSTPQVENVSFIQNSAGSGGGAVHCVFGQGPIFSGCTFEQNSTPGGGGGAVRSEFGAYPIFEGCVFSQNEDTSGWLGGAIYHSSSISETERLIVRDCLFDRNKTTGFIFPLGGAIAIEAGPVPAWIVNSTFIGNEADLGGGAIYHGTVIPAEEQIDAEVINCRFLGNTSHADGGAIYSEGPINITNTVFSGNVADDSYGQSTGRGGAIACIGAIKSRSYKKVATPKTYG